MTILPLPAKLSRRDVPTADIELGEEEEEEEEEEE